MADMLNVGSAWLEGKRKSFLSRSVTYQRATHSVAVAASVGKTLFQIDDGYGAIVTYEARDFLILAADLILNSVIVLPQGGDLILDVQGSTTFTYELLAPANEQVWRYSDNYRRTLRIHTKMVGSA